ncbi:MAG TPA: DUF2141 domain-containing protein, partial [Vicinamibacterales bacterium]
MNARHVLMLAAMITTVSAGTGSAMIQAPVASGTVVVTITGVRNAVGRIRVALFNQTAGFPEDGSAAYRAVVARISDGRAEVRFDDLPLADYAVSMYHDENDDG